LSRNAITLLYGKLYKESKYFMRKDKVFEKRGKGEGKNM
jgi:hypothetical protein